MPRKQRPGAELPQYLADAIRQAWPDGQVNMPEDDPLRDTYPKLKESLARIPGARIQYERAPHGPVEGPSSYALFFLTPTAELYQFETEVPETDEDGIDQRMIPGRGWMGCVAAISVVGPYAAVLFDEMEVYENGLRMEPDIEPHMFNLDGGKLDMESQYRELFGEEGLSILLNLRAGIESVLKKSKITVIPEADLDRPVPWLSAGEEVSAGKAGKPLTVRQAFFFRTV
jgi:hypothetical protein